MKTLYLIRHAKSKDADTGQSDLERNLNSRGMEDAPIMGERLSAAAVKFDLIYTSPAVRAQTTTRLLVDRMENHNGEPVVADVLYSGNPAAILEFISSIPDSADSVGLVFHNPDITDLVNALGDQPIDNMPTCSIYGIRFGSESWRTIMKSDRETVYYDYPKKI